VLGFVVPLASAVAHSVNFVDMAIWGVIALGVQLAAYGLARLMLPGLPEGIPAGNAAKGIFVGVLSLAMGVLNAACMTY
jgi:putative membrane protein